MTYLHVGHDKSRDLTREAARGGYRFGRVDAKRVRVRTALSRISGYFSTMIAAIADSKVRRMERELALRGIHFDRSSDSWVTPRTRPPGPSR
jgi:hypothetical protein